MHKSSAGARARRRAPLVVTVIAAAAIALGGCSASLLPVSLRPTATATSSQPRVGQCWDTAFANANVWANWEGSPASACSASHDLYTFAVVHLTGLLPTDWATSATNPALSDTVTKAAGTACDTAYSTFLPGTTWNQQLLQQFFFVPSRALWKDGARWVRCDIGLIGVGSPYSSRALGELPTKIATLTEDVTANPDKYKLCIDTTHSLTTGPFADSSGVIADCTDNPQFALVIQAFFNGGATASYPSTSVANATIKTVCSKAATTKGDVWIGYSPSKTEWAAGSREIDCWAGYNGGGTPANSQNA